MAPRRRKPTFLERCFEKNKGKYSHLLVPKSEAQTCSKTVNTANDSSIGPSSEEVTGALSTSTMNSMVPEPPAALRTYEEPRGAFVPFTNSEHLGDQTYKISEAVKAPLPHGNDETFPINTFGTLDKDKQPQQHVLISQDDGGSGEHMFTSQSQCYPPASGGRRALLESSYTTSPCPTRPDTIETPSRAPPPPGNGTSLHPHAHPAARVSNCGYGDRTREMQPPIPFRHFSGNMLATQLNSTGNAFHQAAVPQTYMEPAHFHTPQGFAPRPSRTAFPMQGLQYQNRPQGLRPFENFAGASYDNATATHHAFSQLNPVPGTPRSTPQGPGSVMHHNRSFSNTAIEASEVNTNSRPFRNAGLASWTLAEEQMARFQKYPDPLPLSPVISNEEYTMNANKRFEQLRSSRASRLAARSNQDTDVLSGYPARHWSKEASTISLAEPKTTQNTDILVDQRWAEPPMPRGSEMYAVHAQAILRKLRAPTIPDADKVKSVDADDEADEEDTNLMKIPRYNLVALGEEGREAKFLADRRKGLPPLDKRLGAVQVKRKAKVRQILVDGTEHIIEVLVPEGRTVPGEIAEAVAPSKPAESLPAGTIVDGVGVANVDGVVEAVDEATVPQSNYRKPPPPKRKKGAASKGQKKKVMIEVQNPDGTVEMVESGTPRPDEEGDDEDDGEDGGEEDVEVAEDSGTTPNEATLPDATTATEPAQSMPLDSIQTLDGASDIVGQPAEGEAMDVEVGASISTRAEVDTALPSAADVQAVPTVIEPLEPATVAEDAALPPSASLAERTETLQSTAEPAVAQVPVMDDVPAAITAPDTVPSTMTLPTDPVAAASIPAIAVVDSIMAPTAALEAPPAPVLAPETESQPAEAQQAVTEATIPAPILEPAPTSEQPPNMPDATAPAIAVSEPSNDQPKPAEQEVEAAPVEDAVPDELKPEEIALSNPTEEEAVKLQHAAEEKAENGEKGDGSGDVQEQPDILGSLEKSLG